MNSPHGSFYIFKWTHVYLYFPEIIERNFKGLDIWVLQFSLFYKKIMSKLKENAFVEDLISTQCKGSCLCTNYYDA